MSPGGDVAWGMTGGSADTEVLRLKLSLFVINFDCG